MDVRVNRLDFLSELTPMQGIVEKRTTIPVLSHILLNAAENHLKISATDLEVSLTSSCEGIVKQEGSIAIQAKKLIEIIRASSGEEVELLIKNDNSISISIGNARFTIRGLPSEDFPTLPSIEAENYANIPFGLFKSMASKISFSISAEESRFQLSGALLKANGEVLSLVATDGHRLALSEEDVENVRDFDGVLVPRKALAELQRFESENDLCFRRSEHHLSFTLGQRQLICRVLEGTFPDYEAVIAKSNDNKLVIDRKLLADVVYRVSLLTGDRTRAIKLEPKPGLLVLSAANPDLGEATEEIPCDYEGEAFSIGLNPDYLRDFLTASETEKVRFDLKDGNSQCLATPVGGNERRYVCVIMPIRL